MTLEEIMAKAKWIYEHVDSINTMGEAKQAVRDASSMIYYLAKHLQNDEAIKKAGL